VYLLFVGVGFRVALRAEQPFLKLLAAGLTTMLGVQTFIILGGVTRLIPLTGITMPFVSYGGSSLLANFVILALLLRISDEVARRAEAGELHAPPPKESR
jgi:cell division protein FtsW (lipid II flippase)